MKGRALEFLCREGFRREHDVSQALCILRSSQGNGNAISRNMFYRVLQACICKRDLFAGRELFQLIMRSNLQSDSFLCSHLIRMFVVCGSLAEANDIFAEHPHPTVYMWNAIISAHTNLGYHHQALELYNQMQHQPVVLDGHVFVAVIHACCGISDLTSGEIVHGHILEASGEANPFVGSALIDMYGTCGSVEASCAVFDTFGVRDVVMWSSMITSHAQHGMTIEALQCFEEMSRLGFQPNRVALLSLLTACSHPRFSIEGKLVHTLIVEHGMGDDVIVGNSLINMYTKSRGLEDACAVFDKLANRDVVTWNVLIAGHIEEQLHAKALKLFEQMLEKRVQPDRITFMSILKEGSDAVSLDQGKLIHAQLIRSGLVLDVLVGSLLINMYTSLGCLEYARNVFDGVREHDVIIYSAMIGGFVDYEQGSEAIKLLCEMQHEHVEPDKMTFASIVKACSIMAALEQGRLVHAFIVETDTTLDIALCNALIDMYGRSGSLKDAACLFSSMQVRDLVTWNAIMLAYMQNNEYGEVLHCFQYMQQQGVQANEVTFLILLSGCCLEGLVSEAFAHFNKMRQECGIKPLPDHYVCMVDLLGCSGHLSEAEGLLISAQLQHNIVGWLCLLGHCVGHKDVALARRCFDNAYACDSKNAVAFTLMLSIYVDAGLHDEAEMLMTYVRSQTGHPYTLAV